MNQSSVKNITISQLINAVKSFNICPNELIGFVDIGDPELNYATLKKSDEIASHVFVFLVRSIVYPLKFSLANSATTNATSIQLFTLFWKAVGIQEENVQLKVVGVTSDGASPNRRMYRMHLHMIRVEDANNHMTIFKSPWRNG